MANLNAVIAAHESLQRCRFEPQVSVLVTGDGRITIPAIDFLSFGGITENMLLNDFVKFSKRDKLTMAFRLLLDLDWDTSPGGINCKLSFNLLVSLSDVDKLRRSPYQSSRLLQRQYHYWLMQTISTGWCNENSISIWWLKMTSLLWMWSSEWGLDVFRSLTSDIEKLIEKENELLNTSEPSH